MKPARVAVFALIAGGGTGGHVYPALALADALVARGHAKDSIRFLGAQRGLETRAVPDAGPAAKSLRSRRHLPSSQFDRKSRGMSMKR